MPRPAARWRRPVGAAPPPPPQPFSRRQLVVREAVLLAAAVGGDALTKAAMAMGTDTGTRLPGLLADNATHATLAGLCWWVVLAGGVPGPLLAGGGGGDKGEDEDDDGPQQRRRRGVAGLLELAAAFAAGSLLDLDHFVAAQSAALTPALALPQRPPGHCLTNLLLGGLGVFVALRIARAGACCCLASFCRPCCRARGQGQPRWQQRRRPAYLSQGFGDGDGNDGNGGGQRECVPPAGAPLRWSVLLVAATLSHQLRDAVRRGLWLCPLRYSTPALPYPVYLFLLGSLPLLVRRLLAWALPPSSSSSSSLSASAYRAVVLEDGWEWEFGDQSSEEDWGKDDDDGDDITDGSGRRGGLEMRPVVV